MEQRDDVGPGVSWLLSRGHQSQAATRILGSRFGPGRSVCPMPDLLEPPDAGRRDRQLTTAEPEAQVRETDESLACAAGSAAPVLLFQHVSKWYGPVIGVNQVTLELRPGITGLVGSNGAGKSTLMRLITGQLRPDIGRGTVRGEDAWGAAAKRRGGYWPRGRPLYAGGG